MARKMRPAPAVAVDAKKKKRSLMGYFSRAMDYEDHDTDHSREPEARRNE